jgi:hypothetical protein
MIETRIQWYTPKEMKPQDSTAVLFFRQSGIFDKGWYNKGIIHCDSGNMDITSASLWAYTPDKPKEKTENKNG